MIVLKRQKPDNHTIIKFLLRIDFLKSRGGRMILNSITHYIIMI